MANPSFGSLFTVPFDQSLDVKFYIQAGAAEGTALILCRARAVFSWWEDRHLIFNLRSWQQSASLSDIMVRANASRDLMR